VIKDPTEKSTQDELEDGIDAIVYAVWVSVAGLIASKLKQGQSITNVYTELPKDMQEITRIFQSARQQVDAKVKSAFESMATANDAWAAQFYKAANVEQVAIQADPLKKLILERGLKEAAAASDLVQTSVVAITDGVTTQTVESAYKAVLNTFTARMVQEAETGITAQKASTQVVSQLIQKVSGQKMCVVYQSGRTMELNAAVRMNVMDAYRNCLQDLRYKQGEEFGANGVEVSSHDPCAPDHVDFQGRQYTYAEWKTAEQGASGRLIGSGQNCTHVVWPVIVGVNVRSKTDAQLKAIKESSEEQITFKGVGGQELTKSRYECTQYQRQMERSIRKQETAAYLNQKAGNEQAAKALKAQAKSARATYKSISEQMGLKTRLERTKTYVL
jgi:hypothetical protein